VTDIQGMAVTERFEVCRGEPLSILVDRVVVDGGQ
jgi:hypothetical protein